MRITQLNNQDTLKEVIEGNEVYYIERGTKSKPYKKGSDSMTYYKLSPLRSLTLSKIMDLTENNDLTFIKIED